MKSTMKTLDTLKVYERFKKAKTSDAQARELAEILSELVDDQLATKNDVLKLNTELQVEIKNSEMRLHSEIEKSKAATIQWVAALLLAQSGLIAALVKLL